MSVETLPLDLPPAPKRWTAEEYLLAAEAGALGDARTELIDGEILVCGPQDWPHAKAVNRVFRALSRGAALDRVCLRCPVRTGSQDMTEPDVVLLNLPLDDLTDYPVPDEIALIVEVSGGSLIFDRTRKAALYARVGIPEYWIVNLRDREVEVHREPAETGYREVRRLPLGSSLHPLDRPDLVLTVDELLP